MDININNHTVPPLEKPAGSIDFRLGDMATREEQIMPLICHYHNECQRASQVDVERVMAQNPFGAVRTRLQTLTETSDSYTSP